MDRQAQPKQRRLRRHQLHLAAHPFRQTLAKGEAQPSSAWPACDEGFEQPVAQIGRHAGAGIGHIDKNVVARLADVDRNRTVWLPAGGLEGVADQVEDNLFQFDLIAPDADRGGNVSEPKGNCRLALKWALPQSVWRTILRTGRFRRDSGDFKEALVARERCFRSKR